MFNYFYGQQAEQFAFYRIPKVLFTEAFFHGLSTDAKLLYGLLLDRMNLSARNGWHDRQGRVYIIFPLLEIQEAMGCADKKATRLLLELENGYGLIERVRRGQGKPSLIYVKNFIPEEQSEGRFQNRQNNDSGTAKTANQEPSKQRGNNTDKNYTDLNQTDSFLSSGKPKRREGWKEDYETYRQYFETQLDFKTLRQEYPFDEAILNTILELLVETMCSKREWIRIASDDKPAEQVKSRFMELNSEHIKFVLWRLKETPRQIRNFRQYLLTFIFNAPVIMDCSCDFQANYDLAHEA